MRPQISRVTRLAGRRFNSSSSSSSSSSSGSPLNNPNVQKAVEGAQKAYAQSAATVKKVAGPLGERVGSALGGYREPLVYNAKVASSLARQVWQAEKLAPPLDASTWARAYSEIWAKGTNGGYWKNLLKTGGWAGLGVAAAEAYGLFSIGEIIGRRNLVGYNLKE
ncbi:F-type H+-transporting ATPase subunit G [Kwoniella heveanensis CBS 569]|uniref:F-type H+-transporting ATPase subunit G n=1 Tax=Kwoniella heveanensis BCC8398 TaxID=1296120 RepID=A0A1B9GLN7_9TREE|nr:F-type H+-transporting ATPase subunit G [Kwoniella heveanensis BCC8398]OCF43201.1 F-type H+-transporting ATPase subunit G [Kwoniella heveanensis CBS 569]